MKNQIKCLSGILIFQFAFLVAGAQQMPGKINSKDTVVIAGPEYGTSGRHQWLWGRNYRKDWTVPVKVPIIDLSTTYGGLKPVKAGGGNQTKSLQVETKDGKLYALRTVNKTLGKVLPKEFLGTFIEDLVDDKVSMSHPYGAAAVPLLAKTAGVYHTYPQYVYLPRQPALDTFNDKFADKLYLFEQKIDSDWEDSDNLGNYKKYISTKNLLGKKLEDNDNTVDQRAYLRARFLDLFINDWDRHEDQWEWGERKTDSLTVYTAVPQDRDQAFFTFNGVLLKTLIGVSGLSYFQPFKDDLKNVKRFNYEQRNLDRFFANELSKADWMQTAKQMQAVLTDSVIEAAVRQMPPESFAISGQNIIQTLKARREKIDDWANEYYLFLAREVDIAGSEKHEKFEVKRLDEKRVAVNIYKITKEGKQKETPLYSRVFTTDETREIRLYGISGNDVFDVSGQEKFGLKIRLIGGDETDSFLVRSSKIHIYDNRDNYINAPGVRKHLSSDTSIHSFKYNSFLYSKRGLAPTIFFSNDDRLFVGLRYSILTNKWRKEPFASKQAIQANYSISQRGFSGIYSGYFPKAVGRADMELYGMYDQIRWTNFFGLGNETEFAVDDIDYYRARTEEWEGRAGLLRRMGRHHVRLNANFRRVRVIQDLDRFVGKQVADPNNEMYKPKAFAGPQLGYYFHILNDSIAPTKGIQLYANASYMQNLQARDRAVGDFSADAMFYIPLVPDFSLALRAGAKTVTGNPEFYQYASLGGSQEMRAFRRGRYWGKTAVYNSNELRYIKDVKSYVYNGKLGFLFFYDNGRVWMPNEKSNVWHDGYGFGVFLAPFNKISADVTYGFSRDDRLIQLRLARTF
ncbi:BamA/TamA family outer membrane protein [Aridibaculum aurantiacum]|uniref:BamA/TamA family outer membrane protein n=1 Tax=Aridibaculum aurantiacum TaxID=2810307 RepID=UPI001A964404|nr:BamA/TamA family outer membrane protein [Aridibaculum aurantiacum]